MGIGDAATTGLGPPGWLLLPLGKLGLPLLSSFTIAHIRCRAQPVNSCGRLCLSARLPYLPLESCGSHRCLTHQQFQDKLLDRGKAGILSQPCARVKQVFDKAPVIVHQGPQRAVVLVQAESLSSLVCEVGQRKTRDHRTWWNTGKMPPSHRGFL